MNVRMEIIASNSRNREEATSLGSVEMHEVPVILGPQEVRGCVQYFYAMWAEEY